MTAADERLLCRCPSKCAAPATQEDGLCDTCRLTDRFAVDPSRHGDSPIAHARAGCVHIGPVGTPPGARTTPAGVTLSSWVVDS